MSRRVEPAAKIADETEAQGTRERLLRAAADVIQEGGWGAASVGAIAERVALPDGSYTMDHTATLYLLDPQGRMAAVFSPPFASASLRTDLEQLAQRRVL